MLGLMSFTFTRAQEHRALYMLVTAGYGAVGALMLAKFWSGGLGLYIDRLSLVEAQRLAQVPTQGFVSRGSVVFGFGLALTWCRLGFSPMLFPILAASTIRRAEGQTVQPLRQQHLELV